MFQNGHHFPKDFLNDDAPFPSQIAFLEAFAAVKASFSYWRDVTSGISPLAFLDGSHFSSFSCAMAPLDRSLMDYDVAPSYRKLHFFVRYVRFRSRPALLCDTFSPEDV